MKNQDEWMKKRMEDIPNPVVIGSFEMTDEEKVQAKKELDEFIKETAVDNEG